MQLRSYLLAALAALGAAAGCSPRHDDRVAAVDTAAAVFPVVSRVPAPVAGGTDLHAIGSRADQSEVWIAGSAGTILHSRHGELHRDSIVPQRMTDWRGIAFTPDGSVGVAVGSDGQVADYSTDQDRWIPRPTETSATLNAVWLDDAGLEAYAAGAGGVLLQRVGQTWTRLEPGPGQPPDFGDVAASESYVWARDTVNGRIHVFTRHPARYLGVLPRFSASRVWSTSPPPVVWRAGVRLPAISESAYAIVAKGTREDTIGHVPFMPRAAVMSGDHQRGFALGPVPNPQEHDSAYYAYVTRRVSYVWPAPGGDTAEALAGAPGADSGWVAGRNGLVGRFRLEARTVEKLSWEGALARLDGVYRLKLGAGAPPRTLDSLALADEHLASTLLPGRDYTVRNSGDTLEFEFTPAARVRATRLYAGKEVKLQLFVGYRMSKPAFTVAYVKREPFVVGEATGWRSWLNAIGQVPGWVWWSLALIAAILFPRVLRLILDPDSWLSFLAGPLYMVVKTIPFLRRWVLRPYTLALRKELPSHDLTFATEVVDRGGIASERLASNTPTLVELHAATGGTGLLWIEDAARRHGRAPLDTLARAALRKGRIPTTVKLDGGGAIPQKLGNEWSRAGVALSPESMLKGGGFVVLLDCAAGGQPDATALSFASGISHSNLVVVSSPAGPPAGEHFSHIRLP